MPCRGRTRSIHNALVSWRRGEVPRDAGEQGWKCLAQSYFLFGKAPGSRLQAPTSANGAANANADTVIDRRDSARMGQSSSQIAPTQVPTSVSKSWLPFSQHEAPPKKPKKRARPGDTEDDGAHKPKKSKHDERESPKEPKPNRAIPQHRRGTSIKPRDDTAAAGTADGESDQNESHTIVVAQSPSTIDKSKNHAPAENVSGRVNGKKSKSKPGPKQVVELEVSVVSTNEERTDGDELKDGTIVNGIGNSGPRKKRRKKDKDSNENEVSQPQRIASEESIIDVAAFNEAVSPNNSRKDGVLVSPVGQPGPKPRKEKKNKKRKAVETHTPIEVDSSTQPSITIQRMESANENEQMQNDVDDPEPPKKKTKKRKNTAAQAPEENKTTPVTRSDLSEGHSDGLAVNSIGDPGPKRKNKKSKKVTLTPATSAPDNDEPQTHSRPGPVNTSTMAEEGDYRPQAMRQFQSRDRGTVTGKWTHEEMGLADKVFQDFCKDNGVSAPELKLKTTNWATVGPLKVKLYEAFPRRTITNIRRHCQRRFSPYEKGVWSVEETQRLKDAYAKYPDDWPQIAKEVERGVQACRDHWTNQVKYEETMDRGAWSIAEEAKLKQIVEEAVALIVETTEDPDVKNDPIKAESMINWDEVAAKMDGKRSRKRCFEKWRILKRRTKKPQAQSKAAPPPTSHAEDEEQKKSRKQRWLDQEHAKMGAGDVYDALCELMTTLNQIPQAGFYDESTLWSVIATHRDPASRFKATSLVRRTYLSAVETYDCKKVRRVENFHLKVHAVLRRMYKLEKKGRLDLDERRYVPKEPRRAGVKGEKKSGVSEETVIDSDDEVEAGVDAERANNIMDESDEMVIPETQSQQAVAGAEEESEAEVNSLDQESLRSGTPFLTPEDFMQKCKKVGKKQHRAYLKGYGR